MLTLVWPGPAVPGGQIRLLPHRRSPRARVTGCWRSHHAGPRGRGCLLRSDSLAPRRAFSHLAAWGPVKGRKKGSLQMALHQMRTPCGAPSSRWLAAPQVRIAVILVVGLAGMVQLALVREHFAEQFVSGLVFLALALFQLNLALLLALRAGAA